MRTGDEIGEVQWRRRENTKRLGGHREIGGIKEGEDVVQPPIGMDGENANPC